MTREEWERKMVMLVTDYVGQYSEKGRAKIVESLKLIGLDYDSVREAFLSTMFKPGTIRAVCEICGEPKQFDREVPPNYYECECKERGRGE